MVLKGIPEKVDLDYILTNYLGELGWYQKRNIILMILPLMLISFGAEFVFSASKLTTRCHIDECDGPDPDLTPSWLLEAVPGSSLRSFDNCRRYAPLRNTTQNLIHNTTTQNYPSQSTTQDVKQCSPNMFDVTRTVPCEKYVYDRTDSVVYDFGLECDEWRRTLAGTLNSIGSLLVLPITGYVSDRWGRRVALCINTFNLAWAGTARAFSVNYEMYSWLHFVGAFGGAGTFSCCYLLATELVGPKYRVVAGVTISTFFALGQVVLGLLAWALPGWRLLCMVLFIPMFAVVSYFWILSESVRWLISKRKYEEVKQVLRKAAGVNKREVPDEVVEALIANDTSAKNGGKEQKESLLITRIVKSPCMLRRCCTTPVWWVTSTFVYYGLSINSVSLAGNMYINYVIVCAIEIPGYWMAIYLLNRIGRKITLFCNYILCAACCIALPFIPMEYPEVSLVLYLLGKLSISCVITSIYIYTAELYPTRYRHSLLGFSSMVGRIGSITAPLTPALMIYWRGIPSIMFGSLSLISGLLSLTTPETLGITLPDTIEEAEAIGRKTTV